MSRHDKWLCIMYHSFERIQATQKELANNCLMGIS